MTYTIAHISLRKIWPVLLFVLLLLAGGAFLVVKDFEKWREMRPLAMYVTVTGLFLFCVLSITAMQLIWNRGRALWIENGRLIYLNRFFVTVDCASIQAVTAGGLGMFQRPQIFCLLRNGTRRAIPMDPFAESTDVILRALKEIILGNQEPAEETEISPTSAPVRGPR